MLLAGIDAPELRQTCTPAAGLRYACGLEAQQQIESFDHTGEISDEMRELIAQRGRNLLSRLKPQIAMIHPDVTATLA